MKDEADQLSRQPIGLGLSINWRHLEPVGEIDGFDLRNSSCDRNTIFKNIMTVDDLMTLFALFTLTVQYHDHHQDDYHLDAKHTPNENAALHHGYSFIAWQERQR